MRSRIRRIGLVVAGVAIPVAVLAIERTLDTLGIAVAYKAKMLCSGVFLTDRRQEDVLAEIERDDLEPLRFIRTSVDYSEGVVKASALGVVRRQAATRGATGCAIVPRGMTRSELHVTSVRDTVGLHGRKPAPPLLEASSDDSVRLALGPVLDEAFSEPDTTRPRRTQAVVIVHKGRIVAERYAPGINAQSRMLGWSMTKSVMNALIGILVREGSVQLDSAIPLPEWRQNGDSRAGITWNHLLHMESGLRFDEGMASIRSDVIRMLLATDNMAAFASSHKLEAPPGTRWQYASGTTLLLSRAVRNVLNDDLAYITFPRDALFDPIGMSSAVIETDASGTFVGSSLMYATARDWARFGLLYQNDGVWNGERILPEGWLDYTRTPAASDPNRGYGAHFWLGVPSEPGRPVESLPVGALQAAGHEGQFITIVPSHAAVIVRLGRTRFPGAWNQGTFVRDVLSKLGESRVGLR